MAAAGVAVDLEGAAEALAALMAATNKAASVKYNTARVVDTLRAKVLDAREALDKAEREYMRAKQDDSDAGKHFTALNLSGSQAAELYGKLLDDVKKSRADEEFLRQLVHADPAICDEALKLVPHAHISMKAVMPGLVMRMMDPGQLVTSKMACNLRMLVAMAALILRAKNDPLGRLSVADAEKKARVVVSGISGCAYICPCPRSADCMCTCGCVLACTPGDECAFA